MPNEWTRRTLMRQALGTAAGLAVLPSSSLLLSQDHGALNGRQRGEINRISGAFRRQFSVPALSIAISRKGQFVYDDAAGMADREHAQQVGLPSLFRIASVTKPITSVTIFTLIEKGKLHLNDKVFGPSGLLGNKYGKPPYKQYVTEVTVDHLLTHTSGGWPQRLDRSDVPTQFLGP